MQVTSFFSNKFCRSAALSLGAALAVSGWVSQAQATEPRKAAEPRIMAEPGEITNVVDAFDHENGNPFDVHITLGYQHTWQNAKILRETHINEPGLSSGGFTSNRMNVAEYKQRISRLNTRLDVGLYKDIGIYFRLPVILSDSRELSDLGGSASNNGVINQAAPSDGGPVFSVPFKSPTRSGIEYLAVGLDFGIFNQMRDSTKPTWVFGFEGRFNVSEPMHACNPNSSAGQVECAHPSDVNRNGVAEGEFEGSFNGGRDAGVSRGTTILEVHSMMSRRVKYIEPYGGFRGVFEFANSSSDYGATNLDAVLTSSPPLRGTMILGMHIIPWEVKEKFQRLTFDTRFTGTYRSEGRDYSPLFDAIGSTNAASLRNPNFSRYTADPNNPNASIVDQGSQKVYVTGLTNNAAHGRFRISGSAQFQAAEYIKFQVGVAYTYIQAHSITGDQPCNPDFKNEIGRTGPCRTSVSNNSGSTAAATGIPNPLYRAPLDVPGRRYIMDDAYQIDAWVNAVVMF